MVLFAIRDIRLALKHSSYLSALALALTIPDICGQIEYPHLTSNSGKRNIKKQYEAWFNEWVNQYYADFTGWTDNFSKAKNPYFTGEMCYRLRCSFLHAGNSDIGVWNHDEGNGSDYLYEFRLAVNGADSFKLNWSEGLNDKSEILKTKIVTVNIDKLCECICLSAEKYYQEHDYDLFNKNNICLINYK